MVKVGEAVNLRMLEYHEEAFFSKSQIVSVYFKTSFDKGAVASISDPSLVQDRYFNEDVLYGPVTTAHIARMLHVETPVIEAIIELTSVVNEVDYSREGRSLEALGIAGLSEAKLPDLLQEGSY